MPQGLLIISCRPLGLARPCMSRLDVTSTGVQWMVVTNGEMIFCCYCHVGLVRSATPPSYPGYWGSRTSRVVRHLSEILSWTSLVWFSAVPGVEHSVAVPAGMVGIPPPLLTVITVLWYLQPAWNTCRPSQTRRREGRSSFRRRFRSRRVKPGSVKISKDFQDLLSKKCYFVEKNVKEVGEKGMLVV